MNRNVIVIVIVIVLSVLTVYSCSTPRMATTVVRETTRDTLYLNHIQYDSIYVDNRQVTDRSKDTIYVEKVRLKYKYKLLRDTVRVVQIDSIPVIREVDIVPPYNQRQTPHSLHDWFEWIKANCNFDQLILETSNDKDFWIHVSCRKNIKANRHQVFYDLKKK